MMSSGVMTHAAPNSAAVMIAFSTNLRLWADRQKSGRDVTARCAMPEIGCFQPVIEEQERPQPGRTHLLEETDVG